MMQWFKDWMKGPGNLAWDLGRFLALVAGLQMIAAQWWNMSLGLPIELGPTGLGGGLGLALGGIGALIYAKDKAGAEAKVATAIAECPPEPPKAKKK
jgi:hypothetical protein